MIGKVENLMMGEVIHMRTYQAIYDTLFSHYGPQGWWPADSAMEMMLGAILVQHTNWNNVEKAMKNVKVYRSPEELYELSLDELATLIRPSGFFNTKAKRIKSFLMWFRQYDYDVRKLRYLKRLELREQLLQIHGIGKETADVILLYAFGKPIFVVDAYARRLFKRLGFNMPDTYDAFRSDVERELPESVEIYNEYHALIVMHAKVHCKATPICTDCPLWEYCERQIS
ncbi:endonuclease III domain-containing protein [Virgibacillus salarius]|nr:endonuclease III domain-containing protein [Virgibacillus salarius]WBX81718.1 endonuclease III domain-containing protein [Virgibacillus salarius]